MTERVEETIKKENKKAGGKFIVLLICCGLIGAVMGFLSARASTEIPDMAKAFEAFMTAHIKTIGTALPIVMAILTAAAGVWSIMNVRSSRKEAVALIEADEDEELRKVERKLSYNLWMTNGLMILHFLVFSVMTFADKKFGPDEIPRILMYTVVVFMVGLAVITLLQQKLVDCARVINPEKKGSVYDLRFDKKWEESCDEAEKLMIYQSAYRAYKAVNLACMILWMIFTIMGLTCGVGFLPAVTAIIIWTVLTFVYNYYALKYSK